MASGGRFLRIRDFLSYAVVADAVPRGRLVDARPHPHLPVRGRRGGDLSDGGAPYHPRTEPRPSELGGGMLRRMDLGRPTRTRPCPGDDGWDRGAPSQPHLATESLGSERKPAGRALYAEGLHGGAVVPTVP